MTISDTPLSRANACVPYLPLPLSLSLSLSLSLCLSPSLILCASTNCVRIHTYVCSSSHNGIFSWCEAISPYCRRRRQHNAAANRPKQSGPYRLPVFLSPIAACVRCTLEHSRASTFRCKTGPSCRADRIGKLWEFLCSIRESKIPSAYQCARLHGNSLLATNAIAAN
jgi:hypothetical protein